MLIQCYFEFIFIIILLFHVKEHRSIPVTGNYKSRAVSQKKSHPLEGERRGGNNFFRSEVGYVTRARESPDSLFTALARFHPVFLMKDKHNQSHRWPKEGILYRVAV